MSYILQIIMVSFVAVFAENTIFARALGTSTLITVARSRKNILGFGICVTYITAVTGALCYFIDKYLNGSESNFAYIVRPLIYIITLGLVYVVTLLCLWKLLYRIFGRIKKYVHISAFNCAVLGAMFLNSKYCTTLAEYIFHGIGIGLGFVFAVYMVVIVYDKLYSKEVPYCFRGYPLLLIYIGILSMAFYGLMNYQLTY
ncbi:MAG: hypothetical protein LUI05_05380 [Oscillospiraceae bacterium]|nr:hypothetical protein [Oscillospiraceae bacterium]